MNPIRVGFIREQIAFTTFRSDELKSSQLHDLKILDVGSGGGLLSESLARLGANVTGIDPSIENINVAKEHCKIDPLTANINYQALTVEEMASSGAKFDAVCSLEVIEHVKYPQHFVHGCLECVKPGGSLFLSTINRTAKSFLLAIASAEYLLQLVPPGTHEWNKFITPIELRMMIEKSQNPQSHNEEVHVQRMSGMVLRPPCRTSKGAGKLGSLLQWQLSENDLDVNYIVHAVKAGSS
mmetsp:Transcript_2788/g.3868  ORF Transcript_2788/g.3868 Transcript_2788/m.3868 type:complete len:239 (-) Transcript_2788:5440-6156(-)